MIILSNFSPRKKVVNRYRHYHYVAAHQPHNIIKFMKCCELPSSKLDLHY